MAEPSSQELDEPHLRQWIGREDISTGTVDEELVRKFEATFNLNSHSGSVAPRLIHFCVAQPAANTSLLGSDGHPARGGFLPPIPLPRRMWAGSSIVIEAEIRVGDAVRRVSRIADVAVKEGKTGRLCFVTVEHRLDVDGRHVLAETQNIVYRDAQSASTSPLTPQPSAFNGKHTRKIDPSAPLLFRYSALTFNGHRIHYDRTYATEVEYYPGLVVHGPLQATLLINLATELKGAPPSSFAFRSQSPLFDHAPFLLHAGEVDGKMKLWTATENGPVAMTAEADWT